MSETLKEKIEILCLKKDRIDIIENEFLEEMDISSIRLSKPKLEIINVDNLTGTTRFLYEPTSWLKYLEDCHKGYNFTNYNESKFNDVLLSEVPDGYPEVINKNGKYYIYGNGKHRLTIAKCLGNKKAKVMVWNCLES